MERKLVRSRTHKVLAGVCGGVAEYFRIDPTIIRLIWIIATFAGGAGLLAYIVAIFVMPDEGKYAQSSEWSSQPFSGGEFDTTKTRVLLGGILVAIGIFALVRQLMPWLHFNFLWPILLVAGGLALIAKR